jgi:hypothetical protein
MLLQIDADSLGNNATQSSYFMSSGATGLPTLSKESEKNIAFPNPVNDYLQFDLSAFSNDELQLTIYSLDGKVVRETMLSDVSAYGFYVSKMEAGAYIYSINSSKKSAQGRFVVTH